jgi:hypothetical protein
MPNELVKPDSNYVARFLDEVAPEHARIIKYRKGDYVDLDGNAVPDVVYRVFPTETKSGFVYFGEDGVERQMAAIYRGERMPMRTELPAKDPVIGPNGEEQAPWQFQMSLALENTENGERYSFVTGSKTGTRAVGQLLRAYDRKGGKAIPLVKLVNSGFQHRDKSIGWVKTPSFTIVGWDEERAAPLKVDEFLGDDIPF